MIDILNYTMIAFLVFNYLCIAYGIFYKNRDNSFATWSLWLVLDLIALYGTYKKGDNLSLILTYCVGTTIVSLALLFKGKFHWGKTETIITLLTVICIVIRFIGSPGQIIWVSGIALFIAGIPYLQKLRKTAVILRYQKNQAIIFLIAIFLSVFSTALAKDTLVLPLVGVIYWFSALVIMTARRKPKVELYESIYKN